MRKTKINTLTIKDIADRYFAEQCKRLGPIKHAPRKLACKRAA
jgi:hypothetical protein